MKANLAKRPCNVQLVNVLNLKTPSICNLIISAAVYTIFIPIDDQCILDYQSGTESGLLNNSQTNPQSIFFRLICYILRTNTCFSALSKINIIQAVVWEEHVYLVLNNGDATIVIHFVSCYRSGRRKLSYDQDTIEVERGYTNMCNFCMVVLVFLTGHGIKAITHAHAEITHLPPRCIIRSQKALSLQPRASQALMMLLIGKCAISAWILVRNFLDVLAWRP